jgi:hypothetical protein
MEPFPFLSWAIRSTRNTRSEDCERVAKQIDESLRDHLKRYTSTSVERAGKYRVASNGHHVGLHSASSMAAGTDPALRCLRGAGVLGSVIDI